MKKQLFPSKSKGLSLIKNFQQMNDSKDYKFLSELYSKLIGSKNVKCLADTLNKNQKDVVRVLGSWQAFRNQSEKNVKILTDLSKDTYALKCLFKLLQYTKKEKALSKILQAHKKELEGIYSFLKSKLLKQKDKHARIVLLSKAMLFITGVGPAFDSVVLKKLYTANSNLFAHPGVWPFCLYLEVQQYIAVQQADWEKKYKYRMIDLIRGDSFAIGHIMNMILWEKSQKKI